VNILCCCPTYRRPSSLLENSIQCFLNQVPVDGVKYHLIMLDDGGTHEEQHGEGWHLFSEKERFPTLASKYPGILAHAEDLGIDWDIFVVWDDDDVYLPSHLKNHYLSCHKGDYSYPTEVWSTYTRPVAKEKTGGRFWGSLAVNRAAYVAVGGLTQTERPDFDQMMVGKLKTLLRADPCKLGEPTYVFRWADTGNSHAQHNIKSPDDPDWYRTYSPGIEKQRPLEPKHDEATRSLLLHMKLPAKD
jgi:glycosyltransferase involved in cell wall biosynthesis